MKQIVYKCFPLLCFSSCSAEILNNAISKNQASFTTLDLQHFFKNLFKKSFLSSVIWCALFSKPDSEEASKQITPLKLLRLLVYLQDYKWALPHSLNCAHHKYALKKKNKKKNTGWLKHISLSYSMTVFDFLSFRSFLSCLPLLVQLAVLRPQEAIRYGKTSPYCFNEIPRVCFFLNEPRLIKTSLEPPWSLSFGRTGLGHRLAHLWHLITAA